MSADSAVPDATRCATGSPFAAAGAWLFVASDTILGWDRFAAPIPASPAAATRRRLAVIVTYHIAQVLLTVAILRATGT